MNIDVGVNPFAMKLDAPRGSRPSPEPELIAE